MSSRGYLNPSEKASLDTARSNAFNAVQNGTLSSAADGLLTDQVVAKFDAKGVTRADAKLAIIRSSKIFKQSTILMTTLQWKVALVKFKTENGRTFLTLFGDDFNVKLFYEL